MSTFNDEAFRWSYALSKQLSSAYEITSNYGGLELDDELRAAVEGAVRPILERRLHQAEHGGCPDPATTDHAPSVCELLADLDWYPPPAQLRALRRLADARFDGDLKLALAFHFEAALEELEGEQ